MKKFLIITHSKTGYNFLQAEEISKILLDLGFESIIKETPESIVEWDIKFARKIIMIVPEWNGSFPYSFKKMIDDSGYPSFFKGKEVLLIGTSSGNFGNIMGITHLQYVLEWVGAKVFNQKICVPEIGKKFEFNIKDARIKDAINEFVI